MATFVLDKTTTVEDLELYGENPYKTLSMHKV